MHLHHSHLPCVEHPYLAAGTTGWGQLIQFSTAVQAVDGRMRAFAALVCLITTLSDMCLHSRSRAVPDLNSPSLPHTPTLRCCSCCRSLSFCSPGSSTWLQLSHRRSMAGSLPAAAPQHGPAGGAPFLSCSIQSGPHHTPPSRQQRSPAQCHPFMNGIPTIQQCSHEHGLLQQQQVTMAPAVPGSLVCCRKPIVLLTGPS